jgi:hypothetical protein
MYHVIREYAYGQDKGWRVVTDKCYESQLRYNSGCVVWCSPAATFNDKAQAERLAKLHY